MVDENQCVRAPWLGGLLLLLGCGLERKRAGSSSYLEGYYTAVGEVKS
jgi:hypothetical protein